MMSSELKSLLEQYLSGSLSEEDFRRLWSTLQDRASDADWLEAIEQAILAKNETLSPDYSKAAEALVKIKERIVEEEIKRRKPVVRILPMLKYAAAIAIAVLTTVLIFYSTKGDKFQANTAGTVKIPQDVEPGGDKAILTLADGSTIVLDNASDGQIAKQGYMQVVKLPNGQIQYKSIPGDNGKIAAISYNTMSTPRGGQYQLILPDGSKVWLNAESSITYPVAFTEHERRVRIIGEVYFEVAKDKTKPFHVETGDTEIEVLGTHFNVKAYAEDGPTKTSLLEGSVKINTQILKPGEAFMNGRIVPTNIEQDVAWKNGIFNFNNQNLSQVMLQLARWYDLQVEYPGGIPEKEYGGEIGRNLRLGQVLKGLENSGVHFELIGKRVVVTKEN
ncbi:MAG: FecR family protein [Chitinophagaceae bacterium]|nr:FecR family protein [Chitinophagaceae bacterium]